MTRAILADASPPCVALDYFEAISYIIGVKQLLYTGLAAKVLLKLPANTAALIRAKVTQYASDPASLANNVKALKGRDGIRLRVGDWRVIMEDGAVLAVIRIGTRGGVYD